MMHRPASAFFRLFAAALVLSMGLAAHPVPAAAIIGALLTVNSKSDANNGSDGVCTLREAMLASDSNTDFHECVNTGGSYGNNRIEFNVPGTPVIKLTANLPGVTGTNLTINGFNGGSPIIIDGAGAHHPFDVWGGATLFLGNLTVRNGSADYGGAVANGGNLTVLNSTFLNNKATTDGGAISNVGSAGIYNSTFSGNRANYGGGVSTNSATLTIYNSTFTGNTARIHGGALSHWQSGPAPTTTVFNTIMANSKAPVGMLPEDCYFGSGAGTLTGSENIIETTAAGIESCSGITLNTADPMLGKRTGSPSYFPLLPGSPAIDTGKGTICSGAPLYNASQNGIPRPQDGNGDDVAYCDIGTFELPASASFKSAAVHDGWIRETSETSGHGGGLNSTATTLRLGDDTANRQYRSVLNFYTEGLPDAAIIVEAKLKLRRQGVTGEGNPVQIFQGFRADVKTGYFDTLVNLQAPDFQDAPTHSYGPFKPKLKSGWYTLNLTNAAGDINLLAANAGATQIRLRFKLDDNNDSLDNYLSLYSGDTDVGKVPVLLIKYYIPPP